MFIFISNIGNNIWRWNRNRAIRIFEKLYPDQKDRGYALICEGSKEMEVACAAECDPMEYITVVPDGEGGYSIEAEQVSDKC